MGARVARDQWVLVGCSFVGGNVGLEADSTIAQECTSIVSFTWTAVEVEIIGLVAFEKVIGSRAIGNFQRSDLHSLLQITFVSRGPNLASNRLSQSVFVVPSRRVHRCTAGSEAL